MIEICQTSTTLYYNKNYLARQQTRTYLGMGEDDINVHDQWACESMGAIQDRTREHLGKTDVAIIRYRRMLRAAMEALKTIHGKKKLEVAGWSVSDKDASD